MNAPLDSTNSLRSLSILCGVWIYRIRQNSRGGKLLRFLWFLLNRESFPSNTSID